MSRRSQRVLRPLQLLALDQHIIRIESRDGKDRDPRITQRLKKRRQHASHRKRKRPLQLKRNPSQLAQHVLRHKLFRDDNRQLINPANNAEKSPRSRPRWNGFRATEPAHRQPLRQNAVFKLVRQFKNEVTTPAESKKNANSRKLRADS